MGSSLPGPQDVRACMRGALFGQLPPAAPSSPLALLLCVLSPWAGHMAVGSLALGAPAPLYMKKPQSAFPQWLPWGLALRC